MTILLLIIVIIGNRRGNFVVNILNFYFFIYNFMNKDL